MKWRINENQITNSICWQLAICISIFFTAKIWCEKKAGHKQQQKNEEGRTHVGERKIDDTYKMNEKKKRNAMKRN